MPRKTFRVVAGLALTLPAFSVVGVAPSGASTNACITETYYSTPSHSAGYKGTSATSYQLAGPGNIHYTETETATQTFTATAGVTAEAGVIIAKASTTFSVSYAKSVASSKAWGYDTSIPAGKTGIMAVMHKNDRVTTVKYTDQSNCTTTSVNFYSYIPRSSTTNLDFCIIRDLYPYGYNNWRSTCVGE